MGRKHRGHTQRATAPAPVTTLQPQAPAPSRWRDPALVVSILSAVVAMVAAFYAYKQASIGREQLAHEELIAQHRALAVGVRVFGDVESALGRCLHTVVHVEDCGPTLRSLEPDLLQAANDPEVATYYPLIHMELESIYFDVHTEQIDGAIRTMNLAAPRISAELRALDRFDVMPGIWLSDGANDVEADAMLIKRFEPPRDAGPDVPPDGPGGSPP